MLAKITNGSVHTFPYSIEQLRRDNPNTSFPKDIPTETLGEYGVRPVNEGVVLAFDPKTQHRVSSIEMLDGEWVQVWDVVGLPAEQACENVRSHRDNLLVETDWTMLADAPVDQTAWATYRQALRDVTQQAGFPNDVVWPTSPEL